MGTKFKFYKGDIIGAASAEDDIEYLSSCYVDTGHLSILESCSDLRVILLGRTGTGKSALLSKLKEIKKSEAIMISPESLALSYLSNSTILNFLSELNVNLDPFFKLLWRHVFTVEILSHHFDNIPDIRKKSLFGKIKEMFGSESREDKEMSNALNYLNEWGEKFWLQTEYRIKDITETLETKLNAGIGAELEAKGISLSSKLSGSSILNTQEKGQIRSRAQQIISQTQVKDLTNVLKLLENVLTNNQLEYYVLIDGLDENWVEERLRYRFIMALILTAKEFLKIKNAKVIIALRRDLIERVFRFVRDSGFQEEKYISLYLPLVWHDEDLLSVLDRRISALISRRYTNKCVTHRDILPKSYQKIDISKFICSITNTPRDVIAFFNECISVALKCGKIRTPELKIALGNYSRSRLRALADEWSADYPNLIEFVKILQRRKVSFKLSTILDSEIEDLCLNICEIYNNREGILTKKAMDVVNCSISLREFKEFIIQTFFLIGIVGLKLSSHEKTTWVTELGRSISAAEINDEISIVIHPKYFRTLGIDTRQ